MHSCSSIHNGMTELTKHQHITSHQYEELGKSRIQRDFKDLQKLLERFEAHDPFDDNRAHLQSLSSGLIGDDSVNGDQAGDVERKIQLKLNGVAVTKASIKRSEQAKSLATMKNTVMINNQQSIHIDPAQLFTRLIVLVERCK